MATGLPWGLGASAQCEALVVRFWHEVCDVGVLVPGVGWAIGLVWMWALCGVKLWVCYKNFGA